MGENEVLVISWDVERTDITAFHLKSTVYSSSSPTLQEVKSRMAAPQPRQNYHAESEAGVNKQINLELYASYVYQSMAFYFDRDDVALKGFHKFFSKSSSEEREHAEKLMKFQNQRGGRIVLQNIHKLADSHGDAQMTDFIEANYLTEQVEAIKELSDYVTNLKRVGTGLGEYIFDKETLGGGE